jgi:Fuc2NAc and GlcNAc transferase
MIRLPGVLHGVPERLIVQARRTKPLRVQQSEHLRDRYNCRLLSLMMNGATLAADVAKPVTLLKMSILFATFCASLLGGGLVRRYALRAKLLDIPNNRSSHAAPTPRGGGLAIAISFLAASIVLAYFDLLESRTMLALIAGGAIAWIGFLDDRRQLSARLRFVVHLSAAIIAVAILGGSAAEFFSGLGSNQYWVGAGLAVIVFAWATNLFNFMDGIDGLAVTEAIFISAAGAILNFLNGGDPGITVAWLCLSAATLGFLPWNWPPARLFMGDVGSGFLGFTLTVLALATSRGAGVPVEVWAILGGVFLVDASITLVRRMVRGDHWLEAHRMHAYQHLALKWRGHLPVTLLAGAINAGWLLPWAFYAAGHQRCAMLCMIIALLPLALLALLAGAGKQ